MLTPDELIDNQITCVDDDGGIRITRGRYGEYYVKAWQYLDEDKRTRSGKHQPRKNEIGFRLPDAAIEGEGGFANALARLLASAMRPGPAPFRSDPAPRAREGGPKAGRDYHPGWDHVATGGTGMRFSRWLRDVLNNHGIESWEFARHLGIEPKLVSGWRSGKRLPLSARTARDVAVALGKDPDKAEALWRHDVAARKAQGVVHV
ncbi:MAG: helix-turn-helix transcriptional regulator [Thermomicrobiales bacterium]